MGIYGYTGERAATATAREAFSIHLHSTSEPQSCHGLSEGDVSASHTREHPGLPHALRGLICQCLLLAERGTWEGVTF